MLGSFNTALSGLRGAGAAIDVIGNNLANLNTTGFKGSAVSFQDVVADVSGSNARLPGAGVASPLIVRQFTQGGIQVTRGRQDAAIQGDGFFVVRPAEAGSPAAASSDPTTALYTRAGNFRVDQNGILVTATGERVQGWSLNSAGLVNPADPVGDITVPSGSLRPAKATAAFHMDMNLDASAATGATHSVPVSIYDSLGNSHVLSVTFTKMAAANTWDASISTTDPAVTAIAPAGPWTLTFNGAGGLQSVAGAGYNAATGLISGIGLTLGNGAQTPQSLDWSPWQTIPTGNPAVGVGRISQFAQPSASSAIFQDGLAAAQLTGVSIADGGAVMAQYSNGSQLEVGRLTLAAIRNPDSLVASGNNNFRAGVGTAVPVAGLAGTGGRGAILGGSLEGSTVDIAEEFSRLIIYQRAYSANARVITTADDISQETIALKR